MYISKDIFSPSSLLCLSYILSVLCAIYNIDNWRINLHYNTFGLIIIGLLSFVITSLFIKIIKGNKKNLNNEKSNSKLSFVNTNKKILIFLNLVSICIFGIYMFYFIKAVGVITSFEEFSNAMEVYRSKTMFGDFDFIPTSVNFFSKFCRALAYVYSYIIINNMIYLRMMQKNVKFKNLSYLILGVIIYIPLTLMTGGRFDLISYFIFDIILWSILYKKFNEKNINVKLVIKIVLIIIGLILVFSTSRTLVGRTSESETMEYVTEYFGGSIEILDMYMQEEHTYNGVFGQELFAGARKLLNQFNVLSKLDKSEDAGEFRTIYNGKVIGNVYTGFRKMYHDFGISGVIIFQSMMAIIYNIMYYNIKNRNSKRCISMRILSYACINFCLVFHSYSETFFSTVLSFNYFALFAMMYFIRFCILKVKID